MKGVARRLMVILSFAGIFIHVYVFLEELRCNGSFLHVPVVTVGSCFIFYFCVYMFSVGMFVLYVVCVGGGCSEFQ